MQKYSFELKIKVVQDYLSGQGGRMFLAQKYKISQPELIHRWVNAYQTFGVQGLHRKRQNKAYSRQFKLNAVNLYLTSEKSYREIANELGITNSTLLSTWVSAYREKGTLAFSKSRGKPRKEGSLHKETKSKQASELNELE